MSVWLWRLVQLLLVTASGVSASTTGSSGATKQEVAGVVALIGFVAMLYFGESAGQGGTCMIRMVGMGIEASLHPI